MESLHTKNGTLFFNYIVHISTADACQDGGACPPPDFAYCKGQETPHDKWESNLVQSAIRDFCFYKSCSTKTAVLG